jgi:single-strand DNA-binding protein
MFQRVTIIGRVGQEPQMRYTPDGAPVTSFSVATTERISKQTPNGERPCPQEWKESYNGRQWAGCARICPSSISTGAAAR